MAESPKRYRAFISYSQRDKPVARRIHRALESYRIPKGIDAPVGPDRKLGRFFRDDEEMGASGSLGAALTGAIDDAENLIVICSPAAAKSTWVDAEVRRFKTRAAPQVFALIVEGEPHAADTARECFPPSLKLKVDAAGRLTDEPDEPRAPDLRQEGLARVRAQLAAGVLNIPFDTLWQRDRRRARRRRASLAAAALVIVSSVTAVAVGWWNAQVEMRTRSATQAVALARDATADGRIGDAVNSLVPFLAHRETAAIVEAPLRSVLGWAPAPGETLDATRIQPVAFRDATVLLDRERGAYDISDVGLGLERVIRARDGRRLIAIGAQRVVVFDVTKAERLSHVDNREVRWAGHGFEAPTGLIVVTGAVFGPTNGSVFPYVLAISSDGTAIEAHPIRAFFFSEAAGISGNCETLVVATRAPGGGWTAEGRSLTAGALGRPVGLGSEPGGPAEPGLPSAFGRLFTISDGFMLNEAANPFLGGECRRLEEHTFGRHGNGGERPVPTLEIGLAFESSSHWTRGTAATSSKPEARRYEPRCTADRPCPIVGGEGDPYVRDEAPFNPNAPTPLPAPRWVSQDTARRLLAEEAIFFDHLEANSGQFLTICRPMDGGDACFQRAALGEDHRQLGFLRSPDGRYLYWAFGGTVVDLRSLEALTVPRAVPEPWGRHFDFEFDRPGFTVAIDGRFVTFLPNASGDAWVTDGADRASEPFGALSPGGRDLFEKTDADGQSYLVENPAAASPLLGIASLGGRQYLAVRKDGVLARLDAASNQELWRITAAGLGRIEDVQLSESRRHALVLGTEAWRLFKLEDGFPLSGLLAPPPVRDAAVKLSRCTLEDVPRADGTIAARCGDSVFTWAPHLYQGEIASRVARVGCADAAPNPVEAVKRCVLRP